MDWMGVPEDGILDFDMNFVSKYFLYYLNHFLVSVSKYIVYSKARKTIALSVKTTPTSKSMENHYFQKFMLKVKW